MLDGVEYPDLDGRSVARAERPDVARLHRIENDGLVVVARPGTKRDGLPILGGLEVLDEGETAHYRARDLTFELRWKADAARRAGAGDKCRCCETRFESTSEVALCDCGATFCDECEVARVACHECGALMPARAEAR